MKRSTKIQIKSVIVGNASIIYLVFSNDLAQLINNNYIHYPLLLLSVAGLLLTVIYNVFGGGLFGRKWIKYYIQEYKQEKKESKSSNPWN